MDKEKLNTMIVEYGGQVYSGYWLATFLKDINKSCALINSTEFKLRVSIV